MKHVIISVYGGVAEVEYASEGIEVEIVDFDDIEATGEAVDEVAKELEEAVARAIEEDLEFLRAELSATKQELARTQEKLTEAHRVRDELDRRISRLSLLSP